jgi:hypothetical protein
MKYFQNVVDVVRDLLSPVGKESHYKNGLTKDTDGFTDVDWTKSIVLNRSVAISAILSLVYILFLMLI